MNTTETPKSPSALPWIIAVGAVTFAIGAVGAFAFSQANQSRQNDAIAVLAAQLADMQVTRAQSPDLLAITAPATRTPSTSIPSASAVLAARTPTNTPDTRTQDDKIAEAIAVVNRNKMRMLTEGVVAGLYTVTAETADGAGTRIALNSLNAASTARELEKILAKAAADGDIEVPGSVAANGGAIDSKTLLFDLVQRSLEDGSEKEIAAAEEMSRRAFAASAAKTQVVNGQRFYTVEAGDSLAYISLQFYGSTNAYETIFNANRTAIASPDKIQIGQRLLIPEA
ncbi:MAG: LysM repeat protein [Yoonia sp.]|jgi:LysM repeat protein